MKSVCERKLRKRWSFLDRVFRSRSGNNTDQTGQTGTLPGPLPGTPDR